MKKSRDFRRARRKAAAIRQERKQKTTQDPNRKRHISSTTVQYIIIFGGQFRIPVCQMRTVYAVYGLRGRLEPGTKLAAPSSGFIAVASCIR